MRCPLLLACRLLGVRCATSPNDKNRMVTWSEAASPDSCTGSSEYLGGRGCKASRGAAASWALESKAGVVWNLGKKRALKPRISTRSGVPGPNSAKICLELARQTRDPKHFVRHRHPRQTHHVSSKSELSTATPLKSALKVIGQAPGAYSKTTRRILPRAFVEHINNCTW